MRAIKIIVLCVFVAIISYVGWFIFDGINNRSKREFNENNAVRVLKKIYVVEIENKKTKGVFLDSDSLVKSEEIADDLFEKGFSGYRFVVSSNENGFSANAIPNKQEHDGISLYIDQTGVITGSGVNQMAGPKDLPPKFAENIK
jgi:uncharacterized protein (UPF0371 family)